jgi:tetratricopeptide (TPR) repeat protein
MHGFCGSAIATARENCRIPLAAGIAALAIALCAMGPAIARASKPQGDDRIGKRVVQKNRDFVLRVEKQVVDRKSTLQTYLVEQVNGQWLWLRAEGIAGWARADLVVPVEQAIAYYTDYVRDHPDDPFGYSMRATLLLDEKKDADGALKDYNEAVRLDPSIDAVHANRGNLWAARKEYDKAIADYTEAIRLNPAEPLSFSGRGLAWHAKKEFDKAIADYSEVIRLDPENVVAYKNRGHIWSRKMEYDKAIADYTEAIRRYPNDAAAYRDRGSAWYNKNQYAKAIADFDEAIRLNPRDAKAYVDRGDARRETREWLKSAADYAEAIKLEPNQSDGYEGRAWLWATCPDASHRDGTRAIEAATKACEMTAWKQPYLLDTLAAAYAEIGDFPSAVKWQAKAVALSDDDAATEDYRSRLKLYRQKKPYRLTLP